MTEEDKDVSLGCVILIFLTMVTILGCILL